MNKYALTVESTEMVEEVNADRISVDNAGTLFLHIGEEIDSAYADGEWVSIHKVNE